MWVGLGAGMGTGGGATNEEGLVGGACDWTGCGVGLIPDWKEDLWVWLGKMHGLSMWLLLDIMWGCGSSLIEERSRGRGLGRMYGDEHVAMIGQGVRVGLIPGWREKLWAWLGRMLGVECVAVIGHHVGVWLVSDGRELWA